MSPFDDAEFERRIAVVQRADKWVKNLTYGLFLLVVIGVIEWMGRRDPALSTWVGSLAAIVLGGVLLGMANGTRSLVIQMALALIELRRAQRTADSAR